MNKLILEDQGRNKLNLLAHYRSVGEELIDEAKQAFSDSEYKHRASLVNKGLVKAKKNLLSGLKQQSQKEDWKAKDILEGVLFISYTNYIAMLEARNEVWEYEYMAFARRIGELWELFCLLCWDYPINKNLSYFTPPAFKDVKKKLMDDIYDFINNLDISEKEKIELKSYYQTVWDLVSSGEIKLKLDLHFQDRRNKFVVDFKSGFSSNEKGNTNRLLLVASVYKILREKYKCLILARSPEEQSNHYFQTLKKSGLWDVYCGEDTYKKIEEFTGFNLSAWVKTNITWEADFNEKMLSHLEEHNLTRHLKW